MLSEVYTGYFGYPKWDIAPQKWNIEPIISLALHQKALDKIKGIGRAAPQSNLIEKFPLRGYVLCGHCGKAFTACESRGHSKKYAYYHCHNKECPAYGKSVPAAEIEQQMSDILQSLQADENVMALVDGVIDDISNKASKEGAERTKALRTELASLNKEVANLVDYIASHAGDSIVAPFEQKLRDLNMRMAQKQQELASLEENKMSRSYREAFDKTRDFFITWSF